MPLDRDDSDRSAHDRLRHLHLHSFRRRLDAARRGAARRRSGQSEPRGSRRSPARSARGARTRRPSRTIQTTLAPASVFTAAAGTRITGFGGAPTPRRCAPNRARENPPSRPSPGGCAGRGRGSRPSPAPSRAGGRPSGRPAAPSPRNAVSGYASSVMRAGAPPRMRAMYASLTSTSTSSVVQVGHRHDGAARQPAADRRRDDLADLGVLAQHRAGERRADDRCCRCSPAAMRSPASADSLPRLRPRSARASPCAARLVAASSSCCERRFGIAASRISRDAVRVAHELIAIRPRFDDARVGGRDVRLRLRRRRPGSRRCRAAR